MSATRRRARPRSWAGRVATPRSRGARWRRSSLAQRWPRLRDRLHATRAGRAWCHACRGFSRACDAPRAPASPEPHPPPGTDRRRVRRCMQKRSRGRQLRRHVDLRPRFPGSALRLEGATPGARQRSRAQRPRSAHGQCDPPRLALVGLVGHRLDEFQAARASSEGRVAVALRISEHGTRHDARRRAAARRRIPRDAAELSAADGGTTGMRPVSASSGDIAVGSSASSGRSPAGAHRFGGVRWPGRRAVSPLKAVGVAPRGAERLRRGLDLTSGEPDLADA